MELQMMKGQSQNFMEDVHFGVVSYVPSIGRVASRALSTEPNKSLCVFAEDLGAAVSLPECV